MLNHAAGPITEDLPPVLEHLGAIERDLIETADQFVGTPAPHTPEDGAAPARTADRFRRYWVNLVVDHSASQGAPVVYEDHPAFQNLVGRIEYVAQLGALVTDFNLIKHGALHRANGGYLVLDARRVLFSTVCLGGAQARIARPRDPDRVARPDAQPDQHGHARAGAHPSAGQGRAGR